MGYMIDNPVYDRLTRGDKGPSAHAMTWIGAAAGVVTSAVIILVSLRLDSSLSIAVLILIGLAVPALCMAIGFVMAAILMARYAGHDAFTLLRISGLPSEAIMSGCKDGVLARLRPIRSLGSAFPAAIACTGLLSVAFAAFETSLDIVGASYDFSLFTATCSLGFTGVMEGAIVAMLFGWMWQRVITLGVFIGLRWPGRPVEVAAAGMLAGLSIILAVIAIGYTGLGGFGIILAAYGLIFVVAFILLALERRAITAMLRLIDDRSGR